jgi:Undecaprenyl-phosphate galactose phosphotransferase WbaP
LARFYSLGHYHKRKPLSDELLDIFRALIVLFGTQGFILYLSKFPFSRLWFIATVLGSFLFIPLFRISLKKMLIRAGKWQIPTVILGTGPNALAAAAALKSEVLMGYELSAFLSLPGENERTGDTLQFGDRSVPVKALGLDPVSTLLKMGRPRVVVALESGGINQNLDLIEKLHRSFSSVSIVPALRGLPLLGLEVNHFFRHELLLLRLQNNLARPLPRLVKRGFDIVGSGLLLLFLAPFFAFIVLKIRQSGGSAFFGHQRIGQNGVPFNCYKFRSMVPNAQEVLQELLGNDPVARLEWEQDFKLKNDPRITPIGAFLRKTSLDELPQLWNVLRGEMSLVGPRPVIREELERYQENVHYYHEVKPGMTGLWQISGRNDTDYANRVYLDSWYVKNWSLWYDITILFKTVNVVLQKKGAY